MKLTEHFSLEEMTKTSVNMTAEMEAMQHRPSEAVVANLTRLCRWLERLRMEWNLRYGEGDDPIVVNRAYRSAAVNRAVGGVPTSNHLTGCAADIRVAGIEQLLRYAVILLDISDERHETFDELLLERRGSKLWLHFAVRASGNRCKVRTLTN